MRCPYAESHGKKSLPEKCYEWRAGNSEDIGQGVEQLRKKEQVSTLYMDYNKEEPIGEEVIDVDVRESCYDNRGLVLKIEVLSSIACVAGGSLVKRLLDTEL